MRIRHLRSIVLDRGPFVNVCLGIVAHVVDDIVYLFGGINFFIYFSISIGFLIRKSTFEKFTMSFCSL